MRDQYHDAARILKGTYRPGVPGMRTARFYGKIAGVEYEVRWDFVTEMRTTWILGRKKVEGRKRRHVFSLEYEWIDQPLTFRYEGGNVYSDPAVPGQLTKVSPEQIVILGDAYRNWDGLLVTNHGYNWGAIDHGATGQELAVAVKALAASLTSLRDDEAPTPSKVRNLNPFRRQQGNNDAESS